MLFRLYAGEGEGFPLLQIGQRGLLHLVLLVPALHIDRCKARKLQGGVGGPEGVARGLHLDPHAVVDGIGHLTCQEPAPDELIEPVLLAGQVLLDLLGRKADVGRPDGLVSVLCAGLRLEMAGLGGIVILSVAADDHLLGGGQSLFGETQRVGPHVGDQAYGALPLNVHALIELLGHSHGAAGRHVELPAGLLLEGGGDEGRRGGAVFILALYALDGEGGAPHGVHHRLHLLLTVELHFLFPPVEGRSESPHVGGDPGKIHVQRPVLLRLEGADLLLPLAYQAGGYGLDPPGGEPPADLFPQEGGELVAHDAVQDAPGLLGVHQVHIDVPRRGDRLVHHPLGDLVEGHPIGLVVGDTQKLLQVPGDRLPLPVGVGGEEHFLAPLGRLPELGYDLFLALDGLIVGKKAMLHVHAQLAFGQIPDMSHRCLYLIARPKVLADGLGLGRGFHNY